MPSYLVETYVAHGSAVPATAGARTIHVPEDELCFLVVDAPSRGEAALAAERAGLEPIRVVEAIVSEKGDE
jgi:hypothetical protein